MFYTVAVTDPATTPGQSAVLRNRASPSALFSPSDAPTLYHNFQHGMAIAPDANCLGTRVVDSKTGVAGGFSWQSYRQVNDRLTAFGAGLLALRGGARPPTGWHLGIYSVNRAEWIIAEQAANAYSLVTVALYDTLGADSLEFCVNHSDLSVIVCSFDKISNLFKISHKIPVLKVIISMDEFDGSAATAANILKQWAAEKGIQLLSFKEVEMMGKAAPLAHIPPSADDVATICYTSGTTGNPKGALLTHRNFCSSALSFPSHGMTINSDDVLVSYLPLAHCFERVMHVALYYTGASVGFFRGDVLLLVDDIAALKPTVFPSVPRLLNRIYGKFVDGTVNAPGVKGMLFRRAYAVKLANLKVNGGDVHNFFWDKLLFNKVAAILGGRVRLMVTGAAPIAGDVLNFLRVSLCCEILEGYGQTECAAGSCITFPGDYVPSQVGCPLVCNEVKLVDVPEMSYLATDKPRPRGEICMRGNNVMKGYHKDAAKTAETIDKDGWLHTGDIGVITSTGTIAIIDRKKNIFKLAQGEYVAPEKLENVFIKSEYIAQAFVHGDSLRAELVAVLVPDVEKIVPWAKKNKLVADSAEQSVATMRIICQSPACKQLIMKELKKMAAKNKLHGYEIPKNVHVEPELFSVENELLTPSFKLKRNVAVDKYGAIITELYKNMDLGGAEKAKL